MVILGNSARGIEQCVERSFDADCKETDRSPETRRSDFPNCPSAPTHYRLERGGCHLPISRLCEMVHKLPARKSSCADNIRTDTVGGWSSRTACKQRGLRSLG